MRLRLKASKVITGYPAQVQKIFQAMKTYGLIVADNGSDMYIQGTYDTSWDNDVLNPAFSSIKVSDFEVVQLGWRPAVTDPCLTPGSGCNRPSTFHVLSPCRVLDTRTTPDGPLAGPALAAGLDRVFPVAGTCNVPPTAKTVSANLTVTGATSGGWLTIYPTGFPVPMTTAISFATGQTRANNAMVLLGDQGQMTVRSRQPSGTVQLIVDVNGYFE
jgi:hypothetical protein